MWLLVCYLIACAVSLAASEDCVIDNITPDLSWEATLSEDLTSRWSPTRYNPPCLGNATVVTIKFILKNFFFDAGEETFSIYSWLFFEWPDPRLTWDPKLYGDIDKIKTKAMNIWTPRLKLHNTKNIFDAPIAGSVCQVDSEGRVLCAVREWHEVVCISKLSNWPYDTQTCRFEFGKSDAREKVMFTFNGKRGVSMWGAEYGPGWNIIDYKQEEIEDPESRAQIYFELTIERQAAGLGALAVAPALALSLLTLCTPLLAVDGRTRAPLAGLSELGHFTFLHLINFSIPQHSRDSPTILLYMQCSLVITTISIVLTFIFSNLTKRSSVPGWVVLLNARVLNSPLRHAVRLRCSPDTVVTEALSKRHETEWIEFISVCNSLVFVLIAMMYCSLYCIYIPQPPPLV